MVVLENVTSEYVNGIKALDGISFSSSAGETIAIIGANGAGKTTLFKAMLGLVMSTGKISINDVILNKKNLAEVRKIMGYVSQDSDAQMFMPTVYEDMIFGPLNYGMSKEDADKSVDNTLKFLGISELKNRQNHTLSSGEKRMAAIATILAMKPGVVLMDEPSSNLDPKNRRLVINAINEMESTTIIATHDLDLALEVCDRVILLNRGQIVADGDALDILGNKVLLEDNGLELPLCLAGVPKKI